MSNNSGKIPERGRSKSQLEGVQVRQLGESSRKQLKEPKFPAPQHFDKNAGTLRRRSRRSGQRNAEARMPAMTILIYGLLACFIIIGVIWQITKKPQDTPSPLKTSPTQVRQATEGPGPVEATIENGVALDAIDRQAKETVEGVINAKTVEARIPWLVPVPGLRDRMENFYAREGIIVPDGTEVPIGIETISFAEKPVHVVNSFNQSTQKFFPWTLVAVGDRLLIDWDSSVAYGEMEWETFLETRPEEPTQLRVYVNVSDYYNFEFSDDRKYACFLINARNKEPPLYGYTERGSELESFLKKIPTDQSLPINARFKFMPGTRSRNQVYIEELIHPYWLDVGEFREFEASTK